MLTNYETKGDGIRAEFHCVVPLLFPRLQDTCEGQFTLSHFNSVWVLHLSEDLVVKVPDRYNIGEGIWMRGLCLHTSVERIDCQCQCLVSDVSCL